MIVWWTVPIRTPEKACSTHFPVEETMSFATPPSASAIVAAVELLARYASAHGISDAEEVLMEVLATVHGWPANLVGGAELTEPAESGFERQQRSESSIADLALDMRAQLIPLASP
jgi:hypothetical protein